MDKESILEELRSAKVTHLKWLERAKSLVSGAPIEKEGIIPIAYRDCTFGKWFYTEGQEIALMPGMSVMDSIGPKHISFHEGYSKIFQVYFGEGGQSFFSKLLNIKKKVSFAEQEMAERYYQELEDSSKELLDLIGKLERRINALGEEFFNKK